MKIAMLAAAAVMVAAPWSAYAADHEVMMLNKGAKGSMVFEPDFVIAQVGDTVTFKPTNPGHLAETQPGMLPEGATKFKGKAGKPITVTVTAEGVYGIKCLPHYSMGMVAVILAGKPVNIDAVKAEAAKIPQAKAKAKYQELLAQVPAAGTTN